MAQRFKPDIIGALSQNLGIVTLAASRVTIGGQQYQTVALQHTLPVMLGNKLYCLYAVMSAGIPTLVSSANMNSVGPAGFASWKLVGAFITDTTLLFNSFLSIEGMVNLRVSLFGSGTATTPNQNVVGYVALDNKQDPYGLVTIQAGAYNSATGLFATTQPRITNPIPFADIHMECQIGWATNATNLANTWNIFLRKNGGSQITTAITGLGANTAGVLNWLRSPITANYSGSVAGDFFEILSSNDSAAHSTFIKRAALNVVATKQIKDM